MTRYTSLVATALRRIKNRSGLTHGELAARMGVSQSTISKILGGHSVTLENLGAWLEATGSDLHQLADEVEETAMKREPEEKEKPWEVDEGPRTKVEEIRRRLRNLEGVKGTYIDQVSFDDLRLVMRHLAQQALEEVERRREQAEAEDRAGGRGQVDR